jgi:glycosyltransferase involved in cell wall biosynthesis
MQNTTKQPLVSVIIPAYNYAQYLGRAIRSCLAQTHKRLEIIVIDDGSTDGTAELIQSEFGGQINYLYQKNQGVSSARNTGMDHAKGEFITFLDADDYLTENSIELRLKAFADNQEIGIVISQNFTISNGMTSPGHHRKYKRNMISDRLHEWLLRRQLTFATCSALIRSSLANQFQFPEHISNGEDIAYFAKILFMTQGYLLAEPTTVVFKHPDSQRYNIEKIKRQNMELVNTIFNDPFYAGALEPLRNDFASGRLLSIFRSLYLSGEKKSARPYYLEGLRIKPSNICKINYLTKFLRTWI